ncbi:hypothetical protein PMIT1313_01364 [Prochlorococcus marinus str. MIT 1313]|nr:hypothetical protein PMIT1313_01364 [Prochlorococcus marinus str. MIT 1313]
MVHCALDGHADDLTTSITGPTIDIESLLTYLGEDWRHYVVLEFDGDDLGLQRSAQVTKALR